jgi:hypothetical protein
MRSHHELPKPRAPQGVPLFVVQSDDERMKVFDDIHREGDKAMSIGYGDVCEAETPEEMRIRFSLLLKELCEREGGTPESHRAIQLSNVGYFSGYYSSATGKRVLDWLGAAHPIFGTSHADGTLKQEQALESGGVHRMTLRRALKGADKLFGDCPCDFCNMVREDGKIWSQHSHRTQERSSERDAKMNRTKE